MKKDYIPIAPEWARAEDGAFAEAFWAARWNEEAKQVDGATVLATEEFRLMCPQLDTLPRGARLLDGGCGRGAWTIELTRRGFDVTGLDISRTTVERLARAHPGVRFAHGDVRRLDFPDASFDGYFSWGTFEHYEAGMAECLEQARRVLMPGGSLWITVPLQNWRHIWRDLRPLERWDPEYRPRDGYARPMRFYQWRFTAPELRRELELHGFEVSWIAPVRKTEGVRRALAPLLGPQLRGIASGALGRVLEPLLPRRLVCHMLMAAARRRPGRRVDQPVAGCSPEGHVRA